MPKRKATTQNRRVVRRRVTRPRIPRGLTSSGSNGVYHFKRSFRMSQITFTVGTTSAYGQEFSVNDMPNVTEFSNLFDLIKINAIKIEWIPTATSADANPNSTQIFMPNIVSVIDYTDSTAPTLLSDLMQYPNMRKTKLTSGHKRYFKPKVAQDVVGQGATTGYITRAPAFHSFGVPVTYFGVKWMLDQVFNVASGGIGVDRYVTFYFSCKNVR